MRLDGLKSSPIHGHLPIMGSGVLVLAAASTNRHIPHGSAGRPVSLTLLAEVAWLVDIVVVEITELGVEAVASRTRKDLVRLLQSFLL